MRSSESALPVRFLRRAPQNYIEGLGGRLRVVAEFPDETMEREFAQPRLVSSEQMSAIGRWGVMERCIRRLRLKIRLLVACSHYMLAIRASHTRILRHIKVR